MLQQQQAWFPLSLNRTAIGAAKQGAAGGQKQSIDQDFAHMHSGHGRVVQTCTSTDVSHRHPQQRAVSSRQRQQRKELNSQRVPTRTPSRADQARARDQLPNPADHVAEHLASCRCAVVSSSAVGRGTGRNHHEQPRRTKSGCNGALRCCQTL